MTQIFFYHGASDRIAAIAALIARTFARKKASLIYAPDAALASALDRQLWLHPPTGFIPHVRGSSPLAPQTPVLITDTLETIPQNERLFNLSDSVPPGFSRFASLIEVVGKQPDERQAGRERVKFFKDRGYEIRYFDLSEATT